MPQARTPGGSKKPDVELTYIFRPQCRYHFKLGALVRDVRYFQFQEPSGSSHVSGASTP